MLFLFVCSSLENFQGSLRLARRQIPFNSCFWVFDILFLSAATPASNLTSSLKPRQDAQKYIKRSSAESKHAVAKFQALCHAKAAAAGSREGSCGAAVPHCPQRRGWPGTYTTPAGSEVASPRALVAPTRGRGRVLGRVPPREGQRPPRATPARRQRQHHDGGGAGPLLPAGARR